MATKSGNVFGEPWRASAPGGSGPGSAGHRRPSGDMQGTLPRFIPPEDIGSSTFATPLSSMQNMDSLLLDANCHAHAAVQPPPLRVFFAAASQGNTSSGSNRPSLVARERCSLDEASVSSHYTPEALSANIAALQQFLTDDVPCRSGFGSGQGSLVQSPVGNAHHARAHAATTAGAAAAPRPHPQHAPPRPQQQLHASSGGTERPEIDILDTAAEDWQLGHAASQLEDSSASLRTVGHSPPRTCAATGAPAAPQGPAPVRTAGAPPVPVAAPHGKVLSSLRKAASDVVSQLKALRPSLSISRGSSRPNSGANTPKAAAQHQHQPSALAALLHNVDSAARHSLDSASNPHHASPHPAPPLAPASASAALFAARTTAPPGVYSGGAGAGAAAGVLPAHQALLAASASTGRRLPLPSPLQRATGSACSLAPDSSAPAPGAMRLDMGAMGAKVHSTHLSGLCRGADRSVSGGFFDDTAADLVGADMWELAGVEAGISCMDRSSDGGDSFDCSFVPGAPVGDASSAAYAYGSLGALASCADPARAPVVRPATQAELLAAATRAGPPSAGASGRQWSVVGWGSTWGCGSAEPGSVGATASAPSNAHVRSAEPATATAAAQLREGRNAEHLYVLRELLHQARLTESMGDSARMRSPQQHVEQVGCVPLPGQQAMPGCTCSSSTTAAHTAAGVGAGAGASSPPVAAVAHVHLPAPEQARGGAWPGAEHQGWGPQPGSRQCASVGAVPPGLHQQLVQQAVVDVQRARAPTASQSHSDSVLPTLSASSLHDAAAAAAAGSELHAGDLRAHSISSDHLRPVPALAAASASALPTATGPRCSSGASAGSWVQECEARGSAPAAAAAAAVAALRPTLDGTLGAAGAGAGDETGPELSMVWPLVMSTTVPAVLAGASDAARNAACPVALGVRAAWGSGPLPPATQAAQQQQHQHHGAQQLQQQQTVSVSAMLSGAQLCTVLLPPGRQDATLRLPLLPSMQLVNVFASSSAAGIGPVANVLAVPPRMAAELHELFVARVEGALRCQADLAADGGGTDGGGGGSRANNSGYSVHMDETFCSSARSGARGSARRPTEPTPAVASLDSPAPRGGACSNGRRSTAPGPRAAASPAPPRAADPRDLDAGEALLAELDEAPGLCPQLQADLAALRAASAAQPPWAMSAETWAACAAEWRGSMQPLLADVGYLLLCVPNCFSHGLVEWDSNMYCETLARLLAQLERYKLWQTISVLLEYCTRQGVALLYQGEAVGAASLTPERVRGLLEGALHDEIGIKAVGGHGHGSNGGDRHYRSCPWSVGAFSAVRVMGGSRDGSGRDGDGGNAGARGSASALAAAAAAGFASGVRAGGGGRSRRASVTAPLVVPDGADAATAVTLQAWRRRSIDALGITRAFPGVAAALGGGGSPQVATGSAKQLRVHEAAAAEADGMLSPASTRGLRSQASVGKMLSRVLYRLGRGDGAAAEAAGSAAGSPSVVGQGLQGLGSPGVAAGAQRQAGPEADGGVPPGGAAAAAAAAATAQGRGLGNMIENTAVVLAFAGVMLQSLL